MNPLRVAGVGAGYFSQFHYDAWQRLAAEGLVEWVGVCDRDVQRAVERLTSLPALATSGATPPVFAEVAELLRATQPDLVDIIVPPAAQMAVIEACLAADVAMICQKPFTPDLATARRVVANVQRAGGLLVIHENFRWQPWHRELRRRILAGTVGEVLNLGFRLRPGDGQGPRAYLDRQPYFQTMERFLVHETAIHFIDTFRFLAGEVTGVFARLRRCNPAIAGEDAGFMVFDFTSGAMGLFDGNRLLDHPAVNRRLTMGEMLVEGTMGILRLDGDGGLHQRPFGADAETPITYPWENRSFGGDCVYALQRHVVEHLIHGRPVENTAVDYLRNLEIEEVVYLSAAAGEYRNL
ncbi:MAG: Gfo/Idh/MocA family protein [Candidatus Competibacterales bacterium]